MITGHRRRRGRRERRGREGGYECSKEGCGKDEAKGSEAREDENRWRKINRGKKGVRKEGFECRKGEV